MVRKLWFVIIGTSLVGVVVFAIGIIQAFQVTVLNQTDISNDNGQNLQAIENNKQVDFRNREDVINIAVMGDSIARGTGDQSGYGLTKELVNVLQEQGIETEVKNIAVDGYVSEELLELIQLEANQELLKNTDIAIISIGGNDLRGLLRRDGTFLEPSGFQGRLSEYIYNLELTLQAIRDKNEDCHIVLVGLYNPFNDFLMEMMMLDTEYMDYFLEWNYQAQRLIEQDKLAIYLPTYDLFKWNTEQYISYDNIHPNAEGYQAISKRLANYFRSAIGL
ncbi:GDSL-type esterase/lipase family protein [Desulfuribacillus alkaliarsenatis]|uniref:SGNH hydrolase-type esterase domain-containing protein n=1 Tax=Desulfuribacillus alkaliarsenatis TaxID=766136 RepID=A0A1E5G041_9FIRM|nr:GDSL-type esterase/lipase family protein [Desulfuribacillus alkaliarsenatis]OEF95847.1 hypothetical protein BHF68_10650 [Desulfuribacillus alkaliarsenatis]